ncbi:MAG: GNAT family N-acetyltransferase [Anaerolineae bacterium]|nr:GNAT family N-acetyltransferase [Anaerolineae bacterium]
MSTASTPPGMVFQRGVPDDWVKIAHMVADTWGHGDYIDEAIWRTWAADSTAYLITAVMEDGKIVGFVRLATLGPAEWWLEGLRTDPQYQGQGIGQALLTHIIEISRQDAMGILRFFTNSTNEVMPNLAKKLGFMHSMSYAPMQITAQPADYRNFKMLQSSNLGMAYAHLRRSPMYRVNHFVEHQCTAYYLTKERLGEYLGDPGVQVLGWRQFDQLHGLAILMPDSYQEGGTITLAYLDAPDDTTLRAMLDALRGLAVKQDCQRVTWKVPLGIGLDRLLLTTALEKLWDGELWLYELPLRH